MIEKGLFAEETKEHIHMCKPTLKSNTNKKIQESVLQEYFVHYHKKRKVTFPFNYYQAGSLMGLQSMVTGDMTSQSSVRC